MRDKLTNPIISTFIFKPDTGNFLEPIEAARIES
jgi:hypothetical protein